MSTHRFDPLSFAAGLVFTTLGVVGAAGLLDELDTLRLGWPILLVVFGVLLVASTISRPERPRGSEAVEVEPDEFEISADTVDALDAQVGDD